MRVFLAALAAAAGALAFAVPAGADVFKLKDGRVWEGEIVREDGASVRIKTPIGGFVDLSRADIDSWEKTPPLRDLYRGKKEAIQPPTAKGFFELGEWARDRRLSAESKEAFEIAISLEPDHPGARAALGFERDEGKWVSREERLRAKGLIEFRGRWVSAAERDRILAGERREEIARLLDRHDRAPEGERKAIADALRTAKDPGVEAILLDRFGRLGGATRSLVVEILAGQKNPAALEGLARIALRDPEAGIRSAAAAALKAAGPGGALDAGILALERAASPLERARAAELLGALGDLRAVPALVNALYSRWVYEEAPEPLGVTLDRPVVIGKRVIVAKNVVAEVPVVGRAGESYPPAGADPARQLPAYEVCTEAREALKRLTGVDCGLRKDAWAAWWEKEGRKRIEAATENPPK